jgi:hypothetical protein
MCLEDLPMRQRPIKSPGLRLTFSSSSELEESSLENLKLLRAAHPGHDLLKHLLLVPEAVHLLVVVLAVVVSLDVVILVGGGVKLFPLGAVGDEVGGIAALKAAPRTSPLLVELVQGTKLSRQ